MDSLNVLRCRSLGCFGSRWPLFSSLVTISDRHASPYWSFIRRLISMGFIPMLIKKTQKTGDRTLFFFGACCKRGRHLYTTTAPSCCIPASYCQLSATLQTMSIIVVNLEDNRTVFRIFIPPLNFSFDSPLYIFSHSFYTWILVKNPFKFQW